MYAPYRDRRAALLWADSLIGDAFTGRAPEVRWVLPAELRKVARRSPGIVGDPDQMGQATLRSPKLREVPDPLRSSLRNLMAVVGGRAVDGPRLDRVRPPGRRPDPGRSHAGRRRHPQRQGALALDRQRAAAPTRGRRSTRRSPRCCRSTPAGHDLRRHPHPRGRDRSGDHRPDGEGPRGHRAALQLGRGAGRACAAVEATGTPLPDATVESIRKNAVALKGPLTTPDRHRLPLGQRRAPQGIRALRQRPPRQDDPPRRPVRQRGHRAGAGEPRGALHRGGALRADRRRSRAPSAESMAIVTRARLRADRPLRLRVRPAGTAGARSPSCTRRTSSRW